MKNIFLTGMVRSGTTLLEKLLSNHKDISMLSQPFPQLFIGKKKKFHESINHSELYYVLNSFVNEDKYTIQDFTNYLCNRKINNVSISRYLNEKYSGQLTSMAGIENIQDLNTNFVDWYIRLVLLMKHKDNINYCGSKEVMCEEYIPYFLNNGVKSIIIIRDPRDVMASIHYGKGSSFVGAHRPLLFDLQNWRKSFYFALGNENNKNFYYLKYEDLVQNPLVYLNEIADFLTISSFTNDMYSSGIYSQDGKIWKGNSSFDLDEIISKKSVGSYKNILDNEMIEFIETICYREMKLLGYKVEVDRTNAKEIILQYEEPFRVENKTLEQKYNKTSRMRKLEIDRIQESHLDSYIYINNFNKLRDNNE